MIDNLVMSFWTRGEDPRNLLTRSDLFMWVIAIHKAKIFFPKTIFVCDNLSKKIFIDKLQLPFDNIKIELNDFYPELSWVWGLGKVRAYEVIKEPFIHIDGDVFINDQFNTKILESDLIIQSPEIFSIDKKCSWAGYDFCLYRNIFNNISPEIGKFINLNNQMSYSFGVFGGNDLELINRYVSLVYKTIDENKDSILKISQPKYSGLILSVFLEQYICACLCRYLGYKVNSFIEYFDLSPSANKKYEHFAGNLKRTDFIKQKIEEIIIKDYPKFYKQCCIVAKEFNLSN